MILALLFLLLVEAAVVYASVRDGNWFAAVGVSILGVQHLAGGWTYYDANVRGRAVSSSEQLATSVWTVAFVVPVIGLSALPVYLSIRDGDDEAGKTE